MRLDQMTNHELAEYLANEERSCLQFEIAAQVCRESADRARDLLFARMAGTESPQERSKVLTRVMTPDLVQLEFKLPSAKLR